MPTFYIIGIDKSISEYSERLIELISEYGVEAMPCTLEEYQDMNSLVDILGNGAKFIFLGTNSLKQSAVPSINSWKYERFGCRIGWTGNKCVIFARDTDLPFSDHKEFRDYCRGLQLEYSDVIVPPENPIAEGFEVLKKIFTDKKNKSAHRAQYSVLIHEFMDDYFNEFISSENDENVDSEDADIPPDIKNLLKKLKEAALANLTRKQATWCHITIHTAALACSAVAFIPIPVADAIPITSTQVAMVIGLGKVFNNKITKSDAQILLKTVAAPLAGRVIAKNVFIFVPGVGWGINAAIAGTITEILGWTIANDFATKNKPMES
ncbi:hypothetical protein FACS1894111_12530 [Clostridia bacterium]|nr:hypothetical protein FACS1894111_12530 [Clostridia bacterium]